MGGGRGRWRGGGEGGRKGAGGGWEGVDGIDTIGPDLAASTCMEDTTHFYRASFGGRGEVVTVLPVPMDLRIFFTVLPFIID